MYCRNCGKVMDGNAVVCVNCGVKKGEGSNFCPNCGSETSPAASVCVNCGVALAKPVPEGEQKSKMAAGLLGIFLGGLGVHNFYLGKTKRALVQLLVFIFGGIITCGIASVGIEIWGLVEGIMILTGSINTDGNGVPLKD